LRGHLLRRLRAFVHAVIAHHGGNTDLVIAKDPVVPRALRSVMLLLLAPAGDRLLIAPKRQRQDLAVLAQAPEPLDRDEPIDLFELWSQAGGDFELVLQAVRLGLDFEDNCMHRLLLRDRRKLPPTVAPVRPVSPR
jgi:hypothetical protein